jgi:hypothetical protein
MRASVWSWLLDRLLPRVPDSIAAGEFDCRTRCAAKATGRAGGRAERAPAKRA